MKPQRNWYDQSRVLSPTLGLGGAERWILSLLLSVAGSVEGRCQWNRVVNRRAVGGAVCLDAERMGVPVLASKEYGDQPNWNGLVRMRRRTMRCGEALDSADVLIHWGIPHMRDIVQRVRWNGPSVSVSHGSGDWTLNMTTQAANGSTHFAAVSRPIGDGATENKSGTGPKSWRTGSIQAGRVTLPRDAMRHAWGLQPKRHRYRIRWGD